MKIPFWSKREEPAPVSPTVSRRDLMDAARQAVRSVQRSSSTGEESQREISLNELLADLRDTSFFSRGPQFQRGAVWQAQAMYEEEGYTYELVNEIADFAVGANRLVDFGDEDLNNDFYDWRWNPLNPMETPLQLGHLLAVWLLRDGDDWLEKLAPEDFSRIRLLPLDARFFWSNAGGYQAKESLGVRVNDLLEPEAYIYNPHSLQRYEIQPRLYREIPAATMIHAFKTEYAGQTRGFPWIRRALFWLRVLEDFDMLAQRAMRRMVTNPGYWSYPIECMLQDTDTAAFDPDDADETALVRAVYKKILEETRWEDVDVEPRLPQDIEWKQKQHTGLPENVAKQVRGMVLERVARSVRLSPLALSANGEGSGFLTARIATQGDQKFYQDMQEHVRMPLIAVVECWLDWAMNKSALWKARYQGQYRISFPAMPYADPLKDAAALGELLDHEVTSPQQAIRDSGKDPDRVSKEILDWREKMGSQQPQTNGGNGATLKTAAVVEQS